MSPDPELAARSRSLAVRLREAGVRAEPGLGGSVIIYADDADTGKFLDAISPGGPCGIIQAALSRLHGVTGWDFAVRIETGAHCAWSAEIRVTPDPHRRDGPDRSVVFYATGGLSPEDILAEAHAGLIAWMAETAPPNAPRPCPYCNNPE